MPHHACVASRGNAKTHGEVEAYARLAEFIRARMRHIKLTGDQLATRADAMGNPYVGRRSISHATTASWVGVPTSRTILGLELALYLKPGTLRLVMVDADHDEDPEQERYVPPRLAQFTTLLEDADRRTADRIADRAAEAS